MLRTASSLAGSLCVTLFVAVVLYRFEFVRFGLPVSWQTIGQQVGYAIGAAASVHLFRADVRKRISLGSVSLALCALALALLVSLHPAVTSISELLRHFGFNAPERLFEVTDRSQTIYLLRNQIITLLIFGPIILMIGGGGIISLARRRAHL